MPREREIPPASGEQKQQLVAKCESLLMARTLAPLAFGKFLNHLFVLMGNIEGIETPELTDKKVKKPYAISLEKNDGGQIVLHILPVTTEYSAVSMAEMISLREGRAYIERFVFNNETGQELSFVSYLDGESAHLGGNTTSPNGAAELTLRQLKILAAKIFTAWQKSQGEIIIT